MHAIEAIDNEEVDNHVSPLDSNAGISLPEVGNRTALSEEKEFVAGRGVKTMRNSEVDVKGAYEIAGAQAQLVNSDAARVIEGERLYRPDVRISLTFRHLVRSK